MESGSRSPSPSPAPSFDGNIFVPPSPLYMDVPPTPFEDHATATPPSPIYIPPIIPAPPIFVYEPSRGRSRSRSHSRDRSRGSSYSPGGYMHVQSRPRYPRHRSPPRSLNSSLRSPSPRSAAPARRRYHYRSSRSLSESPVRRCSCAGQPTVIVTSPPPPPPPQSITPMMPPCIPPTPITIIGPSMSEPVDILTFQYNDNKAYAPAAKSYDEAIDIVRDVWPELHSFDRDRIHLFVGSADSRVRVPKVAWEFVLCDLSRYEVMHIQVDEPPPPPQYQGDAKGKWIDGNGKGRRSGGIFSSIKRLFRRG